MSALPAVRRATFGVRRSSAPGATERSEVSVEGRVAGEPWGARPEERRTPPLILLGILALLAAISPVSAGEAPALAIEPGEAWVRAGLAFRCRVATAAPTDDPARGPYRLHLGLVQGGATLAEAAFELVNLGQLEQGVEAVLFPRPAGGVLDERPVLLQAVLTNPAISEVARAERRLDTPLALQRALEADWQAFRQGGPTAPEPALWFEQAGERMLEGASLAALAELAAIRARLAEWRSGRWAPAAGDAELAIRDPVDGSVQPYRVHLPPGAARAPVVLALLGGEAPVGKARWPALPEAWLAAARSAGVAVVQAYPAGDRSWTGVAPRRALLALADACARLPRLDGARVALVGGAAGATGAIALAERHPGRFVALALVAPRLASEAWDAVPRPDQPGGRPAHLVALPLFISGDGDPAIAAWHARVARAGGTPTVGFPGPETPAFWSTLARSAAPGAPRELVFPVPARHGTVTVERLARWGEPGFVRWDGPHTLRAVGIAALTCSDRAVAIAGLEPVAAPAGPRKAFGQATGPLAAYADGPFVVVVGTGEHLAARRDNRALADAFVAAWAAHAHGRPPLVEDAAFVAVDWQHHHLVLIGNARSNRVLAALQSKAVGLPARWDARNLMVGARTWPRHERRAFALAWPHPAADGRLLVVLDGAPAWSAEGPPLAGLPDLVVGAAAPGDGPALRVTMDGAWRLADAVGVP